MTFGAYLLGLFLFGVIVGSACVTAVLVIRHRRLYLRGAERILAFGVFATAALIASYLVPGILGFLNRWTPAIAGLGLALATHVLGRRARAPAVGRSRASRRGLAAAAGAPLVSSVTALLAVLTASAGALAYLAGHATTPLLDIDQLTFHLPLVGRWIQTGSFWGVYDWVPYAGFGNYPENGDVVSLAAISPWRFDFAQRFAEVPYFFLAGMAVYALGLYLGARRTASAVFAAVSVSIPAAILPSVAVALPDALMVAMFGAGLLFLVRADYPLAALALGIALGTKWYGVSAVAAVLALWVLVRLGRRLSPRLVLRDACVVAGIVLLAGGFWLVRNAIKSGSPFYPAGWLPIGAHPNNALAHAEGRGPVDFTIAHYVFDFHVWRVYLLPILYRALRWPGVLLLGSAVTGAIVLVVDWRRRRADGRALLALAATCLLTVVYAFTPASAKGLEGAPVLAGPSVRYLIPAAIPAAAFGAWLSGRLGRAALALEVLGVAAVVDGTHSALHYGWGSFVLAALAVAACAGFAYALWRAPRNFAFGAAALLAIVVVTGGQLLQRHYARHRFVRLDPTLTWVREHSASPTRVGVTGIWSSTPPAPVYPSFGPRLRNVVTYVGDYHQRHLKLYRSQTRFVSGLRRSGVRLLIVGLGDPPAPHVKEEAWARAAGYTLVARSRWFALFRREPV